MSSAHALRLKLCIPSFLRSEAFVPKAYATSEEINLSKQSYKSLQLFDCMNAISQECCFNGQGIYKSAAVK